MSTAKALRDPTPEISPDEFQALEEKIRRTIEAMKSAKEARSAAERETARVRQQMREREDEFDALRTEVVALRREREEVRTRVEKILRQIDALTSGESAS